MITIVAILLGWSVVTSKQRTVRVADGPISNGWPDMRVNINRAERAELSVLPGLGPSLAERIVLDRNAHGPFGTVADLDRVPGIGPAIIERLGPYALVE